MQIVSGPSTFDLVQTLGEPFATLPSIAELKEVLLTPLKTYIPTVSTLSIADANCLKNYVISNPAESQLCSELSQLIGCMIETPMQKGSENNRIFLWDLCIKQPLEIFSKYGQINVNIDRNKIDPSTATMSAKRPDFLCWLKNVLVFKGEEKADEADFATAEQELRNKTSQWRPTHFGNLDYIFSYVAAGRFIGFVYYLLVYLHC